MKPNEQNGYDLEGMGEIATAHVALGKLGTFVTEKGIPMSQRELEDLAALRTGLQAVMQIGENVTQEPGPAGSNTTDELLDDFHIIHELNAAQAKLVEGALAVAAVTHTDPIVQQTAHEMLADIGLEIEVITETDE